jgi:hypothetical protein
MAIHSSAGHCLGVPAQELLANRSSGLYKGNRLSMLIIRDLKGPAVYRPSLGTDASSDRVCTPVPATSRRERPHGLPAGQQIDGGGLRRQRARIRQGIWAGGVTATPPLAMTVLAALRE